MSREGSNKGICSFTATLLVHSKLILAYGCVSFGVLGSAIALQPCNNYTPSSWELLIWHLSVLLQPPPPPISSSLLTNHLLISRSTSPSKKTGQMTSRKLMQVPMNSSHSRSNIIAFTGALKNWPVESHSIMQGRRTKWAQINMVESSLLYTTGWQP